MFFEPQSESFSQQKTIDGWVSAAFERVFKLTVITVLTIGILFRFANLDLKPYWLDEAFTSFRLSGYTNAEVMQQVSDRVLTVQDLQKYQQPGAEKTVGDMIDQIAKVEPQLTPLYFVLLRGWVQLFGASIATIRSLSGIFSVLAFPCLFWLCLELFGSRRIAWASVAVMAISPIQLVYAQEARPLSLWVLTTLAACALLLRSMRDRTILNWIIYAVAISIGLYSHLFTVFLWVGHGIYVALTERFRLGKNAIAFAVASIVAWLSFAPWIVVGLIANREAMAGQSQAKPISALVKGWIRGVSLIFVDFNLDETSPKVYFLAFLGILLGVFILIGTALFFFCKSAPREAKLFVLTMILVPFGLIIASDLLMGASRSTAARYFFPAYLGIQIAVAYVLITRMVPTGRFQKVWIAMAGFVLAIGLLSGGTFARSQGWWNKGDGNAERQLAQVINQSSNAIVLVDDFFVKFLSLSHGLNPSVAVQFVTGSPKIPAGFRDVFVYRASERVQQELGARLKPIQAPLLWKVE